MVDPISVLVTALLAGAAAALKPAAGQAVQDTYNGLKDLIARKYTMVSAPIEQLEQKPESTSRQSVLQEELEETGAAADEEVLHEAQRLLEAVKNEAPDVVQTVGVSMEEIEAAFISLNDILASGHGSAGTRVKNVHASGDIDIKGVRARVAISPEHDSTTKKAEVRGRASFGEGERKRATNHRQESITDKTTSGNHTTEQEVYTLVYDQVRKLNLELIDVTDHLRARLDYLDQLDKPVES